MKKIITKLGKLDPPKEIEYFKGDNRHTGKFTKVLQLSEVGNFTLYDHSKEIIHGAVALDEDQNYVVVEKVRIKTAIPVYVGDMSGTLFAGPIKFSSIGEGEAYVHYFNEPCWEPESRLIRVDGNSDRLRQTPNRDLAIGVGSSKLSEDLSCELTTKSKTYMNEVYNYHYTQCQTDYEFTTIDLVTTNLDEDEDSWVFVEVANDWTLVDRIFDFDFKDIEDQFIQRGDDEEAWTLMTRNYWKKNLKIWN